MKTIDDLKPILNNFNNLNLPGDYEDYEGPLQTVRETMKKNKMSSEQIIDLFEGIYEDNVLSKWDSEGNRILLCAAKYLHIQDLLNHSRYEEVFGEIHIVLKKYIITPYLKANPSDELGVQSRVLDTEEVKVWDYYMISIFEYIKNILEPEVFNALLNKEIMFREILLEELDFPTGYEPVLAELKILKKNQITQDVRTEVKTQVKTTLDIHQYDAKLINIVSTKDILGVINKLLGGFPNLFNDKFYKDVINLGPSNKEISYDGLLFILEKQLDETLTKFKILSNKKKKPQEEDAFVSILKEKLLSDYCYIFFVFFKSLSHYIENNQQENAYNIFFNHFGTVKEGFYFTQSDKIDFTKIIIAFEEYFFSQKSPEFFKGQ